MPEELARAMSADALASEGATASADAPSARGGTTPDLNWVWTEVRKRVFLKVPFSQPVADAMKAAVPLALEGDTFVCGLPSSKFTLSSFLHAEQVKNTIETILQQAGGRRIRFEIIEGVQLKDWEDIRERRKKAQDAIVAMAETRFEQHNYEDVLNQVVAELRQRITGTRDRVFPQVRAQLALDVVPLVSDAADMLFADRDSHEARRIMARTIDRLANFLEMPPMSLALEIERYHREQVALRRAPQAEAQPTETQQE